MIKESTRQIIRDALKDVKYPVRVVLFTGETNCDACADSVETVRAVKEASPRLAVEQYDIIMDRDKREEYGITLVPSFVVQSQGGRVVTFCGSLEGESLILFLEAIHAGQSGRAWFPEKVTGTLALLKKGVRVRVLLENDCSLCRPVAETAVGLALSNRLVSTEIIVADEYPELLAKHKVKVLPYTLFGSALHLDGHVSESEFLEMIFRAEGERASGLDKRCMVCGIPTGDLICGGCKTKIQAEAVDHKRREEKGVAMEPKHGL